MTMRGLTSAYLMRRIYDFKPGQTILLHAAAGGVGLIVSQWAKLLDLNVIGTVSSLRPAFLRAALVSSTEAFLTKPASWARFQMPCRRSANGTICGDMFNHEESGMGTIGV